MRRAQRPEHLRSFRAAPKASATQATPARPHSADARGGAAAVAGAARIRSFSAFHNFGEKPPRAAAAAARRAGAPTHRDALRRRAVEVHQLSHERSNGCARQRRGGGGSLGGGAVSGCAFERRRARGGEEACSQCERKETHHPERATVAGAHSRRYTDYTALFVVQGRACGACCASYLSYLVCAHHPRHSIN